MSASVMQAANAANNLAMKLALPMGTPMGMHPKMMMVHSSGSILSDAASQGDEYIYHMCIHMYIYICICTYVCIQPVSFGVSFLHSHISIDDLGL